MVRTNDHDPIHVHVFKDSVEFKIDATTFKLLEVKGSYKAKDLKAAVQLVKKYQTKIIEQWNEIHG